MTDDPKPGYDFFVSPPAAAPPRPAPAPQRAPQPAPERTRPTAPAGTDQRWALNPETFSQPAAPWRMPRWGNAMIAVAALVLIGSLIAAVAIPMVKRHNLNALYENTAISLPATFEGQAGATSAQSEQALKSVAAGFSSTSAKVYGKNTLGLILIVGFRPGQAMSDQDQADARSQLIKQLNTGNASGAKLDLTPTSSAGRLGGYFGCGKIAPATVCIGTDPGSMVAVVLGPTVAKPESVALQAREATVTRS